MADMQGPSNPGRRPDSKEPLDPATICEQLVRYSSPSSITTLRTLEKLAHVAEQRGDLEAARRFNFECREFVENGPDWFKAEMAHLLIDHGRLLFKEGNYLEAVQNLHDALEASHGVEKLSPKQRHETCYYAMRVLAAVRREDAKQSSLPSERELKYSQALQALDAGLESAEKLFGADSIQAATLLMEKVRVRRAMGANRELVLADSYMCQSTLLSDNLDRDQEKAPLALELGTVYYDYQAWEDATVLLQDATKCAKDIAVKTKALLTLAQICYHQSEISEVGLYLDQAENLWMDSAYPPHIERHVANVRGLMAQATGDEGSYMEYLKAACDERDLETLSLDGRVELLCRRATLHRLEGSVSSAAREIRKAKELVDDELEALSLERKSKRRNRLSHEQIISPTTYCKLLLELAYVEYESRNHPTAQAYCEAAITVASSKARGNPILLAQGYTLRAYNTHLALNEAEAEHTSRFSLDDVMTDARMAFDLLDKANAGHRLQKDLLRLLIAMSENLDLPRQRKTFEADLERLLFRHPE